MSARSRAWPWWGERRVPGLRLQLQLVADIPDTLGGEPVVLFDGKRSRAWPWWKQGMPRRLEPREEPIYPAGFDGGCSRIQGPKIEWGPTYVSELLGISCWSGTMLLPAPKPRLGRRVDESEDGTIHVRFTESETVWLEKYKHGRPVELHGSCDSGAGR